MPRVTRIIGNPGTGKTTTLVNIFTRLLQEGVCADDICYLTFTRKATHEAKTRIANASGLESNLFNWIRTIHSFSYFTQGIDRGQVLSEHERDNIRQASGISDPQELAVVEAAFAYHCLTNKPLFECWEKFLGSQPVSRTSLANYSRIYDTYKKTLGKLDYHDLLQKYVNNPRVPSFHTLIVDEAQDLSALQWEIVGLIAAKAQHLYIAGDPHQAIYQWAGAESNIFEEYPVDEERVLPQSYRIPRRIQAFSMRILQNFADPSRYPYQSRDDEGSLQHNGNLSLHKMQLQNNTESYLFLSRNECFLKDIQTYLYKAGIPYETMGVRDNTKDKTLRRIDWYHEACVTKDLTDRKRFELKRLCSNLDYAIIKNMPWYEAFDALTRQQKEYYHNLITSEGCNVRLGTIHASKGGEADHVILCGDYTEAVGRAFTRSGTKSQEYATLYVGATRSKQSLTLISGQRCNSYNWKDFV